MTVLITERAVSDAKSRKKIAQERLSEAKAELANAVEYIRHTYLLRKKGHVSADLYRALRIATVAHRVNLEQKVQKQKQVLFEVSRQAREVRLAYLVQQNAIEKDAMLKQVVDKIKAMPEAERERFRQVFANGLA